MTPAQAEIDGAALGYCEDDVARGYYFYCHPPEPEPETEEEVMAPAPVAPQPAPEPEPEPEEPTATERLAAMRAEFEEVMATAILDPTVDNLMAFHVAQIQLIEISSRFADQADRVRFQNPEIDRTANYPMSQVGSHIRAEARLEMEETAFRQATSDYGLIYVYEGADTCLYCPQQALILANLKEEMGVEILAVAKDGAGLPAEAASLVSVANAGQLESLGLAEEPVPLVALVEPKSGAVEIIGAGLLTQDVIVRRTAIITTLALGERYGGSRVLWNGENP